MENKALFLDFDGVLFDTMREVFLINRQVYLKKDPLDEIDEAQYQIYSKYKYLVYNIWMFYYYNPLIFEGYDDIVSSFNEALKTRNPEEEKIFCEKFLDARRELVNNHFEFWKNLEVPYEFFYGIKKLKEEQTPKIVIVSKKNKNAIADRFKFYNFNLDIDEIFAREVLDDYNSKGEFIEEYMAKNGITSAVFVDDNINNLKTVKNPSIKPMLALWGNCAPDNSGYEQKEALREIFDYFTKK